MASSLRWIAKKSKHCRPSAAQIETYGENRRVDRPLSLAVFGQPGSGKSFAIKQLAEEIFGDEAKVFEFNLTQFREWGDLVLAFHLIRDAAAKGRIPFVFWDEFDTGGHKWLEHFLAPMQDADFILQAMRFRSAGPSSYSPAAWRER